MSTNFHHASEQKKKNAWNLGLFAGTIFGVGAIVGVWETIWRLGFGPWGFSEKGYFFAVHGTLSYLIHFIYPSYVGDLERTWESSSHPSRPPFSGGRCRFPYQLRQPCQSHQI